MLREERKYLDAEQDLSPVGRLPAACARSRGQSRFRGKQGNT